MKLIYSCGLFLTALFTAPLLHAQEAKEDNIRFNKADRPGLVVEYPYSESIVEKALSARLDKAGFSSSKSKKGFRFYQGVSWAEVAPGKVDVYTKVDGKGNKSTVVLLLSKGYDNYVSAGSDPVISQNIKAFLNSLLPDIQASQLKSDIGAQEEAVRDAEKDYKREDKQGDKQKREKENLEKEISDNVSDKAKTAETLDTEKQKLEDLKDQKK